MTQPAEAAAHHEAVILHWPADDAARRDLARRRVPRLLVLEEGSLPPPAIDDLEDWVWLPSDERDVFARLRRLSARAGEPVTGDALVVHEDGRACIAGTQLILPPAEAAVLRLLADPPDRLRTREELEAAAWGDVAHKRRSLDSRIFVLRRRLAPLGVHIQAVRGRGFVLTTDGAPSQW